MEDLKKQIYELYDKELYDLTLGHSFNIARIKKIVDLIALDVCKQSYITELYQ